MHLLISGPPRVGKTTLIKELLKEFKNSSCGFITEELKKDRRRIGFLLKTTDKNEFIFAQKNMDSEYKLKDYGINIKEFEEKALKLLTKKDKRFIVIDEIGKMELFSQRFKKILEEILNSEKRIYGTIHRENKGFLKEIKERKDVLVLELKKENFKETLKFCREFLKAFTPAECKKLDRICKEKFNISEEVLAESAGLSVSLEVLKIFENIKKDIFIIAGKGNNGADGLVAARYLSMKVKNLKVFLIKEKDYSELNKKNQRILKNIGINLEYLENESDFDKLKEGIYIDGIFGIGFKGKVEGFYKELIEKINKVSIFTISIDTPSGLDSQTGFINKTCIRPDLIISFFGKKTGFLINQGKNLCKKIIVKELAITTKELERFL